jgi:hypothetical protein
MRFTDEVFFEHRRYRDEQKHLDYWREKDKENGRALRLPFFDSMEMDTFNRLLNTYAWLDKYNSPLMRMGEREPTKPTTEEIVEAVQLIGSSGKDLRLHARLYPAGNIKKGLQKKATKEIKCGAYYTELAESGFFADKELHYQDKELDARFKEREQNRAIDEANANIAENI